MDNPYYKSIYQQQSFTHVVMMTQCARVCMCVPGLRRRVLSRKQCIPCPFDFLSFSPSLTHTLTPSVCLSKGIPRKWLWWWLSVWTLENICMPSPCISFIPSICYCLLKSTCELRRRNGERGGGRERERTSGRGGMWRRWERGREEKCQFSKMRN